MAVSADASPPARTGHRWRAYHALALVPPVGMLGGLPFANRVHPLVLGLPFLFAWLVGWVLATSVVMAVILRLDRAHGLDDEDVAATEHAVESMP